MSGFGNDFMYNATMGGYNNYYGGYNYGNYPGAAQGFTGGQGYPVDETAAAGQQAGGGGIGLGGILLGGGAAAAGGYFLANPVKDGKLTDSFVKSYSKTATQELEAAKLLEKQTKAINGALTAKGYKGSIKSFKQYNAVRAYVENGCKLKGLPKAVKDALPATVKDAKSAEKALKAAEKAISKVKIPTALTAKETKAIASQIGKDLKANGGKWASGFKNGAFGKNVKGALTQKGTFNAALKNFKWQKAGKYGLIAAGVLAVGNFLLGRSNNA